MKLNSDVLKSQAGFKAEGLSHHPQPLPRSKRETDVLPAQINVPPGWYIFRFSTTPLSLAHLICKGTGRRTLSSPPAPSDLAQNAIWRGSSPCHLHPCSIYFHPFPFIFIRFHSFPSVFFVLIIIGLVRVSDEKILTATGPTSMFFVLLFRTGY
jgi:hypothetical protein